MMRIALKSLSVYETTIRRSRSERPMLRNRYSPTEWSGSDIVSSNGSEKTLLASSNDTPCFSMFASALTASLRSQSWLSQRSLRFALSTPLKPLSRPTSIAGRSSARAAGNVPRRGWRHLCCRGQRLAQPGTCWPAARVSGDRPASGRAGVLVGPLLVRVPCSPKGNAWHTGTRLLARYRRSRLEIAGNPSPDRSPLIRARQPRYGCRSAAPGRP